MEIQRVWTVYFSATGTTEKIVTAIADKAAEILKASRKNYDFTLPQSRQEPQVFTKEDLVILGTPVYAGRVPNVLLKYFETLKSEGGAGVPVVLYGNRNYDDALIELRDLMESAGFHTMAAAAFIGEHSFSRILAKDRPDRDDMDIAAEFGLEVGRRIKVIGDISREKAVEVKGEPYPYRGYYQPRDRKGAPVDIRKVKPVVNEKCVQCGLCAEVCPMGSISSEDVSLFNGICIKCGACSKKCPCGARYYDDERYLYHKVELEEEFTRRAEPEIFIG